MVKFSHKLKAKQVMPPNWKRFLTESLDQLRSKFPKFPGSFEEFHATLTPEQRAEIVEKMERRCKRAEKGGWGRQLGGLWH